MAEGSWQMADGRWQTQMEMEMETAEMTPFELEISQLG